LMLADMQAISKWFDADVMDVFDFDAAVSRRRATGGTAPDAVREQIEQAKARLSAEDDG